MRETDLYRPVREFLERQGFSVSAEVKDCDIAAVKGDHLVIVELKSAANLRLLIQATDRQAAADAVYVALPEPAGRNGQFRGVERLLKRLGLGLITVRFGPLGPTADKRFDPVPVHGLRQSRKRRAVMDEIAARTTDNNLGGSTGTAIMTAYRESAIFIACCLEALGPMSTGGLRKLGTGDRTTAILSKNYYGWFRRVERGVYEVTPEGIEAIRRYPDLKRRATKLIPRPPST